jgi:ankyrin repeat protein
MLILIIETVFDGNTALIHAIKKDNLEIARLLLRHNADPDEQDFYGSSALIEAAKKIIQPKLHSYLKMELTLMCKQLTIKQHMI